MTIATLFVTARNWNKPWGPSTDDLLYTTEFYRALKKSEIIKFAGKLTKLSEIIQPHKDKHWMLSFICSPRIEVLDDYS